jgi:hypothetical protein
MVVLVSAQSGAGTTDNTSTGSANHFEREMMMSTQQTALSPDDLAAARRPQRHLARSGARVDALRRRALHTWCLPVGTQNHQGVTMKSILPANAFGQRFALVLAAAAAALCLLLGLAGTLAVAPANAATTYACNPGDFCLWWTFGGTGPRYASTHSDFDLTDNLFTGTLHVVSKNSYGFNNSGVNDEVVVFDQIGGSGTASHGRCIRKGQHGDLPLAWQNRIMSFRFVSHTSCNLSPRMIPGT